MKNHTTQGGRHLLLVFSFLFVFFLVNTVSAALDVSLNSNFDSINGVNIVLPEAPVNYSIQNVSSSNYSDFSNQSDFWDNLDAPNDTQFDSGADGVTLNLIPSWLTSFGNDLWCKLTGCSITGNLTNTEWFNGKFNWITGDAWNTFDGSTLLFNESMLSTTYYDATQAAVFNSKGTINAGTLEDTQHSDGAYDSVTFNFTEVAGNPGLDLRINFTSIDSFNRGIIRYKTSTLSGAYPIIQLWNYNTLAWEDYSTLSQSLSFATIEQGVFDDSHHIGTGDDLGVVQMRLYKVTNGNINNHYYVDWLAVSKGFGTPSGQEVDPKWTADKPNYLNKTQLNNTYLNLSGTNANQNIDIGNYNITANHTCYNPTCSSYIYDNGSTLIIKVN